MRRAVIGAIGAVAVVAFLAGRARPSVWARATPEAEGVTAIVEAEPVPPIGPTFAAQPASPEVADHGRRAAAVRTACGLDVASACRGASCASVVVVPDLDGPWGWAKLALSSPRFVASTILRDHGVPSRGIPCGAAIADLVRMSATGVDLADGTEVWCASDDDALAPALCDDLARAVAGPEAARFEGPHVRRMSLPTP